MGNNEEIIFKIFFYIKMQGTKKPAKKATVTKNQNATQKSA